MRFNCTLMQYIDGRFCLYRVTSLLVRTCFISAVLLTILTYLLTPWSRVLLENLTGFLLVKKFPAFYGTRRFITVCTKARHLSLS